MKDLREKLRIDTKRLEEINAFLLDPNNEIVNRILALIEKFGGVEAINRKHAESGKLENLVGRLTDKKSPYVANLQWLFTNGLIRIQKAGEVSPNFRQKSDHN
jgi:hypothetical protein